MEKMRQVFDTFHNPVHHETYEDMMLDVDSDGDEFPGTRVITPENAKMTETPVKMKKKGNFGKGKYHDSGSNNNNEKGNKSKEENDNHERHESIEVTPETITSLFTPIHERNASAFSWSSSLVDGGIMDDEQKKNRVYKRKIRQDILNDYKLREMFLKSIKNDLLNDPEIKREFMKSCADGNIEKKNDEIETEFSKDEENQRRSSSIVSRGASFPWNTADITESGNLQQSVLMRLNRMRALENDTFTLMMLSTKYGFAWLFLFCLFLVQLFLLMGILFELVFKRTVGEVTEVTRTLDVPMVNEPFVSIGQILAIIFALFSQRDLLEGTSVFIALFNHQNWQQLNRLPNGKRVRWSGRVFWFEKICLSYMMKLSISLLTLFTAMVLILQSTDLIDLLKDFTALFIVASLDNFVYASILDGYFGHLFDKELERKEIIKIKSDTRFTFCLCKKLPVQSFFFGLILSVMIAIWTYVAYNQQMGLYFKEAYPKCTAFDNSPSLRYDYWGDGLCDSRLYTHTCGMDSDDCSEYCMIKWTSPGPRLWLDIQSKMESEKNETSCGLQPKLVDTKNGEDIIIHGFKAINTTAFNYDDKYEEFSKCFSDETLYNDNALGLFCFFGDFNKDFDNRKGVVTEIKGSSSLSTRKGDPFFPHN
jgi:hypothetical protein